MTEFQVGDQVSIGGTVTAIIGRERLFIQLITPVGNLLQVDPEELALVERPRKKLRVGSVWERRERPDGRWMVVDDEFVICLRVGRNGHRKKIARSRFDALGDPTVWREVPVEELEREAS